MRCSSGDHRVSAYLQRTYRDLSGAHGRRRRIDLGVDVIVLAQASMDGAGALAGIAVPILSSPSLAVAAAIDVLSSSASDREG